MEQQFTPYTRWLHQHDDDIKQEFPDRPTEAMGQEMDVNYYTVSRRATRLGVGKSAAFMHTSWGKGSKKGRKLSKITEASDTYLQEHFATTKNETLAKHFGVDVKTVRRWARRLGLVKSEAFMQEARRRRKGCTYYTPEQIAYRNRRIAEVYPDGDEEALQRLSDELGVGLGRIRILANSIGLKRTRIEKYPPLFLAELAEYFPSHTDKECAEHFGISKPVVQNIARQYGWKKTASHLQRIYDSNMKAAQKANMKRRE